MTVNTTYYLPKTPPKCPSCNQQVVEVVNLKACGFHKIQKGKTECKPKCIFHLTCITNLYENNCPGCGTLIKEDNSHLHMPSMHILGKSIRVMHTPPLDELDISDDPSNTARSPLTSVGQQNLERKRKRRLFVGVCVCVGILLIGVFVGGIFVGRETK